MMLAASSSETKLCYLCVRPYEAGVAYVKLPNIVLAVVEREKITEYLLNPAHPDNGGKAAFFQIQGSAAMTGKCWPQLFGNRPKLPMLPKL